MFLGKDEWDSASSSFALLKDLHLCLTLRRAPDDDSDPAYRALHLDAMKLIEWEEILLSIPSVANVTVPYGYIAAAFLEGSDVVPAAAEAISGVDINRSSTLLYIAHMEYIACHCKAFLEASSLACSNPNQLCIAELNEAFNKCCKDFGRHYRCIAPDDTLMYASLDGCDKDVALPFLQAQLNAWRVLKQRLAAGASVSSTICYRVRSQYCQGSFVNFMEVMQKLQAQVQLRIYYLTLCEAVIKTEWENLCVLGLENPEPNRYEPASVLWVLLDELEGLIEGGFFVSMSSHVVVWITRMLNKYWAVNPGQMEYLPDEQSLSFTRPQTSQDAIDTHLDTSNPMFEKAFKLCALCYQVEGVYRDRAVATAPACSSRVFTVKEPPAFLLEGEQVLLSPGQSVAVAHWLMSAVVIMTEPISRYTMVIHLNTNSDCKQVMEAAHQRLLGMARANSERFVDCAARRARLETSARELFPPQSVAFQLLAQGCKKNYGWRKAVVDMLVEDGTPAFYMLADEFRAACLATAVEILYLESPLLSFALKRSPTTGRNCIIHDATGSVMVCEGEPETQLMQERITQVTAFAINLRDATRALGNVRLVGCYQGMTSTLFTRGGFVGCYRDMSFDVSTYEGFWGRNPAKFSNFVLSKNYLISNREQTIDLANLLIANKEHAWTLCRPYMQRAQHFMRGVNTTDVREFADHVLQSGGALYLNRLSVSMLHMHRVFGCKLSTLHSMRTYRWLLNECVGGASSITTPLKNLFLVDANFCVLSMAMLSEYYLRSWGKVIDCCAKGPMTRILAVGAPHHLSALLRQLVYGLRFIPLYIDCGRSDVSVSGQDGGPGSNAADRSDVSVSGQDGGPGSNAADRSNLPGIERQFSQVISDLVHVLRTAPTRIDCRRYAQGLVRRVMSIDAASPCLSTVIQACNMEDGTRITWLRVVAVLASAPVPQGICTAILSQLHPQMPQNTDLTVNPYCASASVMRNERCELGPANHVHNQVLSVATEPALPANPSRGIGIASTSTAPGPSTHTLSERGIADKTQSSISSSGPPAKQAKTAHRSMHAVPLTRDAIVVNESLVAILTEPSNVCEIGIADKTQSSVSSSGPPAKKAKTAHHSIHSESSHSAPIVVDDSRLSEMLTEPSNASRGSSSFLARLKEWLSRRECSAPSVVDDSLLEMPTEPSNVCEIGIADKTTSSVSSSGPSDKQAKTEHHSIHSESSHSAPIVVDESRLSEMPTVPSNASRGSSAYLASFEDWLSRQECSAPSVVEGADPVVEGADPVVEGADPVVEEADPVVEEAGPFDDRTLSCLDSPQSDSDRNPSGQPSPTLRAQPSGSAGQQPLGIDDASSPREAQCTLIVDASSPRGEAQCTLIVDASSSCEVQCTLIDDASSPREVQCTLIDDASSPREAQCTLIDDASSPREAQCTLIVDVIDIQQPHPSGSAGQQPAGQPSPNLP